MFPEKLAVIDTASSLTFAQLEAASNTVALYLMEKGLSKGDRILFYSTRQISTIVFILGILKSGGVYVPVDVETPVDRLHFLCDDVEPRFVSSEILKKLDIKLDSIPEDLIEDIIKDVLSGKSVDKATMSIEIQPKDDCYIIYTSGSTGRPKGIPISHDNFTAFLESMESVYNIGVDSVCMCTFPFHFDGSMEDFYALSKGCTMVIMPSFTFPALLLNTISTKRVTHVAITPSLLNVLYQYVLTSKKTFDFSHLRKIIIGGEVCDKKVINFFLGLNNDVELINGYGPTETTCDALTYSINEKSDTAGYFPIGKPLKHINALLLGEDGAVSDTKHTKGELILSGRQVFDGYLKRAEETEKCFVDIGNVRYYKTGDICEIDGDGNFVFLGRVDEEIKLNGFRINLNEIKFTATHVDFINEAEVFAFKNPIAEKYVIYLAVSLNTHKDSALIKEIASVLKRKLPYYMLPEKYILFDEFPVIKDTKVDKKKIKNTLTEIDPAGEDAFYVYEGAQLKILG